MPEAVASHSVEPGSGGGNYGVATPAMHLPMTYRVLMRRGGALLIDSLFWAIPIVGLAIAVGRSSEPVLVETGDGLALSEQVTFHLSFLQMWAVTILWFAYLVVSEWRFGASLGKKAVGIEVARSDGARVDAGAAVKRQTNIPVFRMMRADLDQALATARLSLGSRTFQRAWDAGGVLSADDAFDLAMTLPLEGPEPSRSRSPFGLSPREIEVLQLMAEGHTDQEIADQLSISYRTVTTHVTNIYNKLSVDSRAAAVAVAVRLDIA